ncbi:MAG TPA: TIGR01777 family oxidoreductase [Gammaproteobacteria bacterium]
MFAKVEWLIFHQMENQEDIPLQRVLITGGTGFIGTALSEHLLGAGVEVTVLTRDRAYAVDHFSGRVRAVERFEEIDEGQAPEVIVNLAGKNLGAERWNEEVKRELIASRVDTTQRVIDYIAAAGSKPRLLISGSAVGYYGARGDEPLNEQEPAGAEYQSRLCEQWEQTVRRAEQLGVRVCISRTGVVLGRGGGALSGLLPQFRMGLGAIAGSGRQWVSWIQMQDLIDLFVRFMHDDSLHGAFNNTAPNPVTNREFSKSIGRAVGRPVFLRAPGWSIRLAMGEMAHLYLTGQKVVPERHLQAGYRYRYPDIESALAASI